MVSISTTTVMNINTFKPHTENSNLLKLLRLASPSLPIGGYSYSQGLEFAVSSGWVHDASSASDWIQGRLKNSLVNLDLPILKRLYQSWQELNLDKVAYWNDFILASRDSHELQEEDRQLGKALARLLVDLELEDAKAQLKGANLEKEAQVKMQLMDHEFEINLRLRELDLQTVREDGVNKEDRKDQRTKIQATQQSELIDQRKTGAPPKNFESSGNDVLSGDFGLGNFEPR